MIAPVWMLHRVLEDVPAAFGLPSCYRLRGTAITPAEWTQLLDLLISSGSLRARMRGDGAAPAPVLTFDDGYREWVDLVAPSLRERRFTATFFACFAFRAEANRAHRVDEYYWLLDHARRPHLRVELRAGTLYNAEVDTRAGKLEAVLGAVKQSIVGASTRQAAELLAEVADSLDCSPPTDLPRTLYPTTAEWAALAAEFDVGAHGITHRRATEMPRHELAGELQRSMDWVGSLGGIPLWSHPDGDNDARVRAMAKEAGYEGAVGVGNAGGRFDWPRRFGTVGAIREAAHGVGTSGWGSSPRN